MRKSARKTPAHDEEGQGNQTKEETMSMTVRLAEAILATHQRELVRQNAPTTACIHEIMLASCVICLKQDPWVVSKDPNANGDHVMEPVNVITSSKHSGRGYENTSKPITYDNEAWKLQRASRSL